MSHIFYPVDFQETLAKANNNKGILLASDKVSAGFPSPADDHLEGILDLNELMIKRPAATFLIRVKGRSMRGVGIFEDDILVVDKAETVLPGSIVIAAIDGECLVKIYQKQDNVVRLEAANPKYDPIYPNPEGDFQIWGVVMGVIRKHGNHGRVCVN